jgi:ubiquinone/menaquinone biosynthesis C-methylase UbiE
MEIARMTEATITAIDINPVSLEEARFRASNRGLDNRITFEINNATNLSYSNETFDVVFCGNVTSYVPDRNKALEEYIRVLKNGGILAAVPIYYIQRPSKDLVARVSDAIKCRITPDYKSYWMAFFKRDELELLQSEDYKFDKISDERVKEFVSLILGSPHLSELKSDTRKALTEKYASYIKLFSENLSIMGYTIMLLRKENFKTDRELFTGTKL